jgi:type IV pilus assembly protein PilA
MAFPARLATNVPSSQQFNLFNGEEALLPPRFFLASNPTSHCPNGIVSAPLFGRVSKRLNVLGMQNGLVICTKTKTGSLRRQTMNRRNRRSQPWMAKSSGQGFSLIELLIVVAIILIIAAIAIPNLLRSKMASNEASAGASMRIIITAEFTYFSTWNIGYAAGLANLGGPSPCGVASSATACLIDPLLSTAPFTKSAYVFAGVGVIPDPNGNFQGFNVTGTPTAYQVTGTRSFCSDQTGVIRFAVNGGVVIPAPCNAVPSAPGVSGPIGN